MRSGKCFVGIIGKGLKLDLINTQKADLGFPLYYEVKKKLL